MACRLLSKPLMIFIPHQSYPKKQTSVTKYRNQPIFLHSIAFDIIVSNFVAIVSRGTELESVSHDVCTRFCWSMFSWCFIILCSQFHVINLHTCRDDAMRRKHFPLYWPFVRVIHRSPVNAPRDRWVPRSDAMFYCFLWSAPDERLLSKQSWGWWFETPSHHYDITVMAKGFLYC